MIDPRTPEGRMTLRYRGYRTEVILKELGLDPEDGTRQHQYTKDGQCKWL